jgi:hypothetical protein
MWQLDLVQEYERSFESTVAKKEAAGQLGKWVQ